VLGQRFEITRRIIAMVCVAIAFVVCLQTTVVALDRMYHALGIDHDANPIAGSVRYSAAATDACKLFDQPVEQSSDQPTFPTSHAHSGDTTTSGLQVSNPPSTLIKFGALIFAPMAERAGPGTSQQAPDRPPKG